MSLVAIARSALDLLEIGTVNQKTITVAFMEFLLNQDSNAMKALWLQHGFTDESPIWGSQSTVPTFMSQRSIIEQWPDFQWQMTSVEADWYYLSGHHGRRLRADGEGVDDATHFNTQQEVGFFNEPYHNHTWEGHSPDELEVYMSMSTDSWAGVYEPGPQDNPLYNAPHARCKGLLLVGCNTLVYLSVRRMLLKYFPNAVIIGLMSRESTAIAKILRTCRHYGRQFFVDPKSVAPAELCQHLNAGPTYFDQMGVMSDGVLYDYLWGQVITQPADQPLDPMYF